MSTTFRITVTAAARCAHAELDEIARLLHELAARFQMDHERYVGRRVQEVIYNGADTPAGAWALSIERRAA